MSIDFAADAEEQLPDDSLLKRVAQLAGNQLNLEDEIARLEECLDRTKAAWREIAEKALPEAIQEAGLSSFTLTDGRKVHTKQEVYASIPKERENAAFNWLRQTNNDAIIKNTVFVEFGKGQDYQAVALLRQLAELGISAMQKQAIHPMTLKAFLREQIEQGVDVPLDDFGAYIVTRAKVGKK